MRKVLIACVVATVAAVVATTSAVASTLLASGSGTSATYVGPTPFGRDKYRLTLISDVDVQSVFLMRTFALAHYSCAGGCGIDYVQSKIASSDGYDEVFWDNRNLISINYSPGVVDIFADAPIPYRSVPPVKGGDYDKYLGEGDLFLDVSSFSGGKSARWALYGSTVPEPATWLTLVLGFGLAGASLRSARRRWTVRPA